MTLAGEQHEAIRFVAEHLAGASPVEVLTTHASMIVLTGNRAYKMKRKVRFPYLDYSTAEQRHAACLAEFSLNRRTALDLYVAVHTITRAADGQLTLDGAGDLVDALVEMKRFDQECLFDRMAQKGSLTPALMDDLAQKIAAFHRDAAVSRELGGVRGMADVLDINERSLRATGLVPGDVAAALATQFRQELARHTDVLERRRLSGKVRRCHGDLILRNICLWHGTPTLFDCLEFDDRLATIDVLYDLAFLLMDLWHRDQRMAATILLNRYLDETDETDGLGLVRFFMAVRAAVRAHVTAAQARQASPDAAPDLRAEAMQYVDLARSLLAPARGSLVAVGGLSGTGKSTVASLAAPRIGAAPGARILNSDRLRKRLHGVPADTRLPDDAYGPDMSRQVYAGLRQEAERALRVGGAVIVDAVFDRSEEREAIEQLAGSLGVPFAGYWLEAPVATRASRVAARRKGPSDATAEVVRRQAERDCGAIEWVRLDAARAPAAVTDELLRHHDAITTRPPSQDHPKTVKPP